MSRPITKEETGTIRVSLRLKANILRGAKEENLSVPDYMNKYPPGKKA
ncbi:MAG: hypothetical protein M0Q91_05115 [Methanoregula sp.]|jgi:hypothetical protein|nr:hypothetical protein [Methanoregula sp.]